MATGYVLLGLSNAFVLLPMLPELIHYLTSQRILSRNKSSDFVSSLGDFVSGWSDLGGPILGAVLNDSLGFRYTNDAALLLALIACVIFCIWGEGARSLCSKSEHKVKVETIGVASSSRILNPSL